MNKSIVMHLGLASLWLLLTGGGPVSFIIGLAIAYGLLALFKSVLGSEDYVRRVAAFLIFLLVFLREFLQSNFAVAKAVLFRASEDIHPNFITYDVADMKSWEIFLLSHCITLTPGTTSVDLIDGGNTLIVHAFDADEPDEVRLQIDSTLKQAILRFSR
ncbi:MAG: Na+/H+ antiporter subunit E [Verrucomicrobiota bacterium]